MPEFSCPLPHSYSGHITLAHGGGGRLSRQLVTDIFRPAFAPTAAAGSSPLDTLHDGACLASPGQRIALATDAHVVSPHNFPGGDIGALAVHGTCNDLAMCAARPRHLTAAFILEEGLPLSRLAAHAQSMGRAAREIDVSIVAGDTKVVARGQGDGLYIATTGIGTILPNTAPSPAGIQPGDTVLLTGDLGRHAIAIMSQREGLEFDTDIQSDSAHLWPAVARLLEAGIPLHCLRDCTRGGLVTVLVELAYDSGHTIVVEDAAIPVSAEVAGACEILGLDPLYAACEGRCAIILPPSHAEKALEILRSCPVTSTAVRIGEVRPSSPGTGPIAIARTPLGTERVLDFLTGEQLPRIC